jgi:hypothetical protein
LSLGQQFQNGGSTFDIMKLNASNIFEGENTWVYINSKNLQAK